MNTAEGQEPSGAAKTRQRPRRAAPGASLSAPPEAVDPRERLHALTGVPIDRMVVVVHLGEPARKERPRFDSRRGRPAFTPTKTTVAENALAWEIRAALRGQRFRCNVAVLAVFYRSSRQRIDVDNLVKLAMDSATKAGAWVDDSQVTTQAALLELDRERPRTVLVLCECESTMDRKTEDK